MVQELSCLHSNKQVKNPLQYVNGKLFLQRLVVAAKQTRYLQNIKKETDI